MNDLRVQRGFTLIELMITVAIIAILAAVALPSYQDSVRRGRRSDGHALLQAAQLAQEKFRLNNTTYAATASLSNSAFSGVCTWSGSECRSTGGYYVLTMTGNSATDYTLTATTRGSQTADTACSTITISQASGVITRGPSATCWPH